jgi:sensor histidine kinase YesM
MKTNQFWNFIGIAIVISFVLGILIHFSTILTTFGFIQETPEDTRQSIGVTATFAEVLVSSLVAFCTFLINYYIIKPFDSSIHIKPIRILAAVFITVASVTILSDLFFTIKHLLNREPLQIRYNLIYTFRDLFMGIIVISGIYIIKTVFDRQTVKIENEKLKNEKLLGQYESLKNQMSPHFLFNSLTALRELIDQDAKDAKLYISHLSLVLRYTLSSIDAQSKSLFEEMEVAESYLHLVKIRFGTSLRVETSIDDRYKDCRLPPLAIQILLENAIKHNEISKKNPFTIKIETSTDQNLVITNPIQERASKEFSTGIGLSNLSRQYQYLAGKEITISNKNNEFRVELPLLNPSKNDGVNS